MTRPIDLAINDRITTMIGDFAVVEVHSRLTTESPVEVDVTPDPGVDVWDTDTLALVIGAEWAGWMSGARNRRYRLRFDAATRIPVAAG